MESGAGDARCGIGARLRAGRERTGLTLLQAAERLHVDPSVIEALESERFESLGAAVFVRGHIRRYAELVGESPGELQELFATSSRVPPPPDLTRIPKGSRPPDPRRFLLPGISLLVGLTIFSAVWFVLEGMERILPPANPIVATEQSKPQDAPPPSQSPAAAVADGTLQAIRPSGAAQAADSGSPITARSDEGTVGSREREDMTAAVSSTETGGGFRQTSAAADSTTLRLSFSAESWVEVYDGRGRQILFGLGLPNTTRRVTGTPPLRVVLGNAPGVSVEIDGQGTPIPDSVRDERVAKFVIDDAGRVLPMRLASNGD